VEAYRQSRVDELIKMTQESLALLRSGKLEEGRSVLRFVEDQVKGTTDCGRSICVVLERHYHTVAAFCHYRHEEHAAAWESLEIAGRVVREAIAEHDFLFMLAESFVDFSIQKARVARALRNWPLMWRELWRARSIAANEWPLCVLRDGRAVYVATLCSRLSRLGLDANEMQAWRELVDDELRCGIVERLIREVYTLPGFEIDY
jgi:hypothetical protein